MGYDFMFQTVKDADQHSYPYDVDFAIETEPGSAILLDEFSAWLKKTKEGKENGAPSNIRVYYGNDESIIFRCGEDSIYLDNHADWSRVLEAYEELKKMNQDLIILDLQGAIHHDSSSFLGLINSNKTGDDNSE